MHTETLCEFCSSRPGHVELELLNITGGETLTSMVCPTCAVICAGTRISYDSDGFPYSNMGCIGGAPEEVN